MEFETGKKIDLLKEDAIKSIIEESNQELKKEFWGFVDRIKNFFTGSVQALKDLYADITWQSREKAQSVQENTTQSTQGTNEWMNDISNKEINEEKTLNEYTDAEAKTLFTSVFWTGLVTDAFMHLTNGSGAAMLRTVALAKHEGNLDFDIRNRDPNLKSKQNNYSTFQLSAKNLDAKLTESKRWFKKLLQNTPFANMNDDEFMHTFNQLDVRQQNLALWLWHIMSRPKPYQILADLGNPDLSETEVATLMSKRIQWGISDIGKWVVKQMKTAKAGDYFAAMRSHGYEPRNIA